ncbi:conserved hypothetical protein [Heliomicrobium modesticaldum Ice1]|uniref:Uncharacterized protein n=1 Tax=Heliobacterium modesticaldum (strain ATCC 51547 / Ice1) TaxID=498761 RepID=B0TB32_HELMI|nr:DUF190 domain-containing protein [Heliomicrobium modesticaldum]ABZ83759.1 conserved hypothetical protein [Heliomicrobium modesticaldum Ice1]
MTLPSGKAKMLKIYVGETEKFGNKSLYHAILLKLKENGLAGVTVSRGVESYGAANRIRTTRILDLSADLPMIIEAVDTSETIDRVLPFISEMVKKGLIITFDVDVIKQG